MFGISVKLTSVHPAIDSTHIVDATDVGGELAADQADKLLDDLRNGEAECLPMRCEIRAGCGNGCHWNLPQI
jgi:hypothetical protein